MSFSLNFLVPCKSEVVCFVGGNNAQLHRGLAGEIAVNIADAVANDVIVGDDVGIFADDETAA